MEPLPMPPVPADTDLRDFPFTPIFRARLFGSSFHARSSDGEWRAGVTLWLKSWDQVPAGSLPDDDIELCRLAELGRDTKTWKKLRSGAMRGWYPCSDGLLYHDVVADGVNDAIQRKIDQRTKTLSARIAALKKRLSDASEEDVKLRITDEIKRLSLTLSQTRISAEVKHLTDPVTESVTDPVTASKRREGKRRDRDRDREEKGFKSSAVLPSSITEPVVAAARRGSRLSETVLPDEWRVFCLQERVDLIPERVFESFRDYWVAQPGKGGVKLDWIATWRNWVKREIRSNSANGNHPSGLQPGAIEYLNRFKNTEKEIEGDRIEPE